MSAVPLVLTLLVGIAMGLLGGGGSILMVPILRYVSGLEAQDAITTSLLVVGLTSAVAAAKHARVGRVRYRTGLLFGAGGMLGAFVGGKLGALVEGRVLLILFALVMVATGVAMLRPRRSSATEAAPEEPPIARLLVVSALVGSLTGLVGAGGGFLIVPALVLFFGLPMEAAVGTSLLVIALQSASALVGKLGHVQPNWDLGLGLGTLAMTGSLLGARIGRRTNPQTLRKAFGVLVLVMAVVMLARELGV